MRSWARSIGKWSLRAGLVSLILLGLYVGLVVYPTPLFAHDARFGDWRVYSDAPIPADFDRVIEEAAERVAAMEHSAHRPPPRIYLCDRKGRYGLFARLLRKNPETLATGITLANEMFISMSRVREFAERNRGGLRHTRFEGNPAEVIAHEIAHFHSVDALGLREHLRQPMWKSEGWAEYQANLAAIRDDPGYDLAARIENLLDDGFWGVGQGIARSLWESQLLVEYLGEVRGYRLADLSRDEVTLDAARRQMLAWYRGESTAGSD